MFDLIAHLTRQAAFSRATFGPGPRTKGVIDHVKKELREIEKVYQAEIDPASKAYPDAKAAHSAAAAEWVDVAILGLDGLLRALWAANPEYDSDEIAQRAVLLINGKQGKNERREWPDWRTASADEAIEHHRGIED